MSKKGRRLVFGLLILGAGLAGGTYWVQSRLVAMPKGPAQYMRFETSSPILVVLRDLQKANIIRDSRVAGWYARFRREPTFVKEGTYRLSPGMEVREVLIALRTPVRQMVRIPETNLSYRNANILEKMNVCEAAEYRSFVAKPSEFAQVVGFALPRSGNLEGYLYPDTYDFPPLFGARNVIKRQLAAFERKAWPMLKETKDVNHVLTVASMVELEAGVDGDRPIIAGVIENRLSKGMALQIDATLLYAISEWRRLTFKDYRTIKSPYSTYQNKGLPPGPICSPSIKSIEAAMKPTQHDFLYYVAKPDRTHLFAKTYAEHLANIAKIRRGVS